MPTLPLYKGTLNPDAYHHVTAPGGYEWWYFDAEDPATDTQIVAIFLEGFIFHPGYLRRHFAYLRRPTRVPPALPRDYVCAYFVIYRGGKIWRQFMTQYPSDAFLADDRRVDVTLGPNRLQHDGQALQLQLEGTPWRLTARGPQLVPDQTLAGRLTFTPRLPHPPELRAFFSPELACGADHMWVIANPLCDTTGTITCGGETIRFSGLGYHDHNYGTGPIGPGLRRWIWGRVLYEDRVTTFHYAVPRDRRLRDEIHLMEAGVRDMHRVVPRQATARWNRLTGTGLAYPSVVAFDDVLSLANPRVIDAAPFYMRLMYDAQTRGRPGKAFCEVAYPHRLRWPVLGRMIEMSIDKRALG